ncbi:hypothetical protein PPSIR1_03468 [Plesiocystis pacifica SIR-1]|uniref:Uncharacterized protein n=1 Tax=Plesiocystis pacifica SIR-1 TaxID=391625 RepID=A6G5F3_9BACT|nr:AIM24 family protein [Plesiocystis pacifica]EDM78896.1 hypothetical protein PPSIR1_03468 [Plesiocystis pacifica SIR-1]
MPSSEIPGVTSFAFSRLLTPEPGTDSISLTREGHLLVNVAGETMTRTDALLLCSENLEIRPLNRRMQGRAVPDVFRRLASLEGEGYLIISREDERFYPLRLERDLCFFVERTIWALDASLMWDVGMLPGSRGGANITLIRVAGEGMVALRVSGELVAIKVSPERPHRVHHDGFVGWVGNVVPSAERGSPFLRCEGEGAVFVALPEGPARPVEDARSGPIAVPSPAVPAVPPKVPTSRAVPPPKVPPKAGKPPQAKAKPQASKKKG